ncbi:trp RNA-binding attenuation protein MtrB [Thermoactinomyces sp. CICC 10521]|jgi:transcription attenuation protein (tryptophan RNA-binding attenuator protein)|uniref:Transcription attenuation protein MtrB n=1 Tax=Thermoactinomyces daqus TaxID=1329516 RepID=A0A7W2AIV2_9BACL|nr:trp RNA-binding attenuation protein MtrB [Thermoactinomyces daqus]MBH8596631.1 trp RNA-binding attenuation protein MtrB [Thermoactinomyces sp. CICC 10523]MBH8603393.1 trp RNA-binding attenuation protein MtrB [Thermoactinomyces sp. CICC 10522]MBH8607840.1 trp RNA-binding attenuation protein MtrB [Thermoactinomyces sp. CICC 10521]
MSELNLGGISLQGSHADYIVIKAKENGVNVIGLTRGKDTRFHHSEKLDKGEVMVAQFTEHTSAIKIRGKAVIITPFGQVETDN